MPPQLGHSHNIHHCVKRGAAMQKATERMLQTVYLDARWDE